MITKKEFIAAWKKFAPTKIEKFYIKHFSKNSESKKTAWLVALILIIPFLFGYLGTVFNASHAFIEVASLTLAGMMVVFAIPWIIVYYMHNWRIKKIAKYLGLTNPQYEELLGIYWSDIKHLL